MGKQEFDIISTTQAVSAECKLTDSLFMIISYASKDGAARNTARRPTIKAGRILRTSVPKSL